MFELTYLIVAVIVLFLLVKFLSMPFKLLYNGLFGVVILWVLNFFGAGFNMMLEINVLNALIAGVFGIPGIIFLFIYKYLF